jgi:DNA replication protein DnaC
VLRYLDPTFVEQARTLALIGPAGLGKTMLAICVATKHIQLEASARFITAQHLANQLGRALTSAGRQRVLGPLLTCDVLVLDELLTNARKALQRRKNGGRPHDLRVRWVR